MTRHSQVQTATATHAATLRNERQGLSAERYLVLRSNVKADTVYSSARKVSHSDNEHFQDVFPKRCS